MYCLATVAYTASQTRQYDDANSRSYHV